MYMYAMWLSLKPHNIGYGPSFFDRGCSYLAQSVYGLQWKNKGLGIRTRPWIQKVKVTYNKISLAARNSKYAIMFE